VLATTLFDRFKKWISRHRKLLLEAGLIVVVVIGISAYQQRNLLATNNQVAPALAAEDLQGNLIDLTEYRGRPVLVYFFAPWCNYCAASADNIVRLRRMRSDENLAIVMVGLDWQARQELVDYSARHKLNVPVLAGDASIARDWNVYGFPTYYVLDDEHRIVSRDFGYSTQLGLSWRTWL
jgi:peroxiredoxin